MFEAIILGALLAITVSSLATAFFILKVGSDVLGALSRIELSIRDSVKARDPMFNSDQRKSFFEERPVRRHPEQIDSYSCDFVVDQCRFPLKEDPN